MKRMKKGLIWLVIFLSWSGCHSRKTMDQLAKLERENEALQMKQREVHAQLDALEHKILVLEDRLSEPVAMPTDTSRTLRLPAAENPIPVVKVKIPASTQKKTPGKAIQQRYDELFARFQTGDCQDTVMDFESFAQEYAQSHLADNARYWVGECFYRLHEYKLAIVEFQKIPQLYPDGNKVPDAFLRMAMSHGALGNRSQAQEILEEIVTKYPNSDAAGKARQRMKEWSSKDGGTS